MHSSADLLLTPEEVSEIRRRLWGPGKWDDLMDPDLGGTPWSALISVNEGVVEDVLRRLAQRKPTEWRRRELIAFRRVMDVALRNASEPPDIYGVPLYVSSGLIEADLPP